MTKDQQAALEQAAREWLQLNCAATHPAITDLAKSLAALLAAQRAAARREYRQQLAGNLGLDHNLRFNRSFTKQDIINALDEVEIVIDHQEQRP